MAGKPLLTEVEIINYLRTIRFSSKASRQRYRGTSLSLIATQAGLHRHTVYQMAAGAYCSAESVKRVGKVVEKLMGDSACPTLRVVPEGRAVGFGSTH